MTFHIGGRPTNTQLMEAGSECASKQFGISTPSGPPKKKSRKRGKKKQAFVDQVKKNLKNKSVEEQNKAKQKFEESVDYLGMDFLDHYGHENPHQARKIKEDISETREIGFSGLFGHDTNGEPARFYPGGTPPVVKTQERRIQESKAHKLGNKLKRQSLFVNDGKWTY